jgi:hypothetical protein
MSIWPFEIGRFIELPYTLVQDYTLTAVLGETTPRIWLEKVDFIESFSGLALLNSHPDYLREPASWNLYEQFLQAMQRRAGSYWHAPSKDVPAGGGPRAVSHSRLPAGRVVGTIWLDSKAGDRRSDWLYVAIARPPASPILVRRPVDGHGNIMAARRHSGQLFRTVGTAAATGAM